MVDPTPHNTVSTSRRLLTDQQITTALARWEAGEPFTKIAQDYGVNVVTLRRYIMAMRGGPVRRGLNEDQLQAIAARLQSGESLRQIAGSYTIPYKKLLYYTRSLRKELPTPILMPQLTETQIAEAIARWRAGESLRKIARSLGVHHDTLYRQTKKARAAISSGPTPLLSPAQITAAVERWKAGASLQQLAAAYKVSYGAICYSTRNERSTLSQHLSPEQIAEAITRRAGGEMLRNIAKTYGITKYQLDRLIKDARPHKKPSKQQRFHLSPKQHSHILARLHRGETLEKIALELRVSTRTLAKHTRHARADMQSLTMQKVDAAMQRWLHGEPLTGIAERLGIPHSTLLRHTAEARKGRKRGEALQLAHGDYEGREILTADRITKVVAENWAHILSGGIDKKTGRAHQLTHAKMVKATIRWNNGEALMGIARDYHVSKKALKATLMFICWRCGMPPERIAHEFGKTVMAANGILRKYDRLQ